MKEESFKREKRKTADCQAQAWMPAPRLSGKFTVDFNEATPETRVPRLGRRRPRIHIDWFSH
jgi:hypothetical protein